MPNEKDLFELVKGTYPLNPRQEFVTSTGKRLRQHARRLEKKRNIKRISFFSSGFVLCAVLMSWIFLFNGNKVIVNNLSSLGENGTPYSIEEKEPTVYITHSHNWESFIPEVNGEDPNDAVHESKNITLVGERLSDALRERNINSIHDKTNVNEILKEKGLTFADSYKVSREALVETLESERNIEMVFDLHRDSHRRSITTIKLNDLDYARIAIVISGDTNNFEKNKDFALLIHQKLEEKYPGLSRGVLTQRGGTHDIYNQDLLDNSLLLEIGGVENTLEEEYRTVDVLAEVIQDVIEKR